MDASRAGRREIDDHAPTPAASAAAMPPRLWPERRWIVLGSAALLFGATILARELFPGNRDELLGLVFVVPIALVGLELGLKAGLAAAVCALLFIALRGARSEPSFDAVGVVMRGIVFLAVGALAGRFSDRMRAFQARQAEMLAVEHERAALAGELLGMRRRLQDQFRNAGHMLDLHERERHGIAEQLHEQAAQAMAAALLCIGRFERDIVDELTQAQLQRARQSVRECIAELRRLASKLHSPVLEELGLKPAFERLLEREHDTAARTIDLRGLDRLPELSADVEVSAYRVIEEALQALPGPLGVRIGVDPAGECLQIAIEDVQDSRAAEARERPRSHDGVAAQLLTARARLGMMGGAIGISSTPEGLLVSASIPLAGRSELAGDRSIELFGDEGKPFGSGGGVKAAVPRCEKQIVTGKYEGGCEM